MISTDNAPRSCARCVTPATTGQRRCAPTSWPRPIRGSRSRLRDLAEAASNEQVAWEHAHAAGLLWRPVPGAENAEPPYELRPGTGRRGPAVLWDRFDAAVATLNHAITGSSAAAVADAFGEFAEAAGELADAVGGEGAAGQGPRSRAQGAA